MMLLPAGWPLRASAAFWLAIALFCILATGCTGRQPALASEIALQLTLIHTNDTMGKLEPCG